MWEAGDDASVCNYGSKALKPRGKMLLTGGKADNKMVAIIRRCRISATAGQCAAIKAGREYAPAFIVVTAGQWDRARASFLRFLILLCNFQRPTSPCHRQIIKTHAGGQQGQGAFSWVDLLEESANVGGAQGTPQPTAAGRGTQAQPRQLRPSPTWKEAGIPFFSSYLWEQRRELTLLL